MIKKIIKIFQIIMIVIICLFIVLAVVQRIIPTSKAILGFRTFVIVSKSMEPELKIGDVILVKKIKLESIKVGDVITYQGLKDNFKDKVITHKVVNIDTELKKDNKERLIFYTKGTNSDAIDPAVYEEQVYGKVVYRFFTLSFISRILRNTFGFIFLVVIPLILLFITEIKEIRSELKERKS